MRSVERIVKENCEKTTMVITTAAQTQIEGSV